jgi:hypothetical protein
MLKKNAICQENFEELKVILIKELINLGFRYA